MHKHLTLRHIPALTGLRAWAFGLVLLDHWVPIFHHVLMAGNGGVSLFLVLSGFLISRLLIESKLTNTSFNDYLLHFYRRRAQRIFPLYFLTLLILLLAGNDVVRQKWVYFFTFTANYYLINNPNSLLDHFWSLSAEEQLYIFIPLLIWLCPLNRLPVLALLLISCSCVFRGGAYYWKGEPSWWPFSYESVLGCLDCYGIGLLVAYLQLIKPQWASQFFSSALVLRTLFLLWLTVLLLGIYWEVHGFGAYCNPVTAVSVRLAVALFGGYLIGYCHQSLGRWGGYLLLNPVFQYLGSISYGLYIVHNLIYNAHMSVIYPTRYAWSEIEQLLFSSNSTTIIQHHTLELTFYFLLTVCLASIAWYALEKPLLNRYTTKPKPSLILSSRQ